jgi:hypothetical protein
MRLARVVLLLAPAAACGVVTRTTDGATDRAADSRRLDAGLDRGPSQLERVASDLPAAKPDATAKDLWAKPDAPAKDSKLDLPKAPDGPRAEGKPAADTQPAADLKPSTEAGTAPYVVGKASTTSAKALALNGSHVYVADGTAGLAIIDVSKPSAPAACPSTVPTYNAQDVAVAGAVALRLDTRVERLREELDEAGRYIEMVRGVGYRFPTAPEDAER